MTAARWLALMASFGFPANDAEYQRLVAAYGERHRHYHTAAHLRACFRHLDTYRALAVNAPEVELALWFHDAVYQPRAADNERRSADWALRFLRLNGADAGLETRIERMIMATEHRRQPDSSDEELLLDIDLAILAADQSGFLAFESQVRREYQQVPEPLYREKRAEVLESFLHRPQLYHHREIMAAWELRARSNLACAVGRLRMPC